jgi:hypothetical protein
MKIEITQEHIDKGEARKARFCPIALALQQVTGKRCAALERHIIINTTATRQVLTMPQEAKLFISRFDSCDPDERKLATPFSFELPL